MGVDIKQGASQIAQLLQPEQPSDSAPVESEPQEDYTPEPPAVEGDDVETPEGDTETESLYTVKVNGEEREVSLDDLRKGYMMESDYRKKTSEVAKQRDEIKSKYEALDSKLADAEQVLLQEAEDLDSEENRELKEYDPQAWYKKKEKLEEKARKLADLKKEQAERFHQETEKRLEKEKELIFQAVPEWLDEETLNSETAEINHMLKTMGFEGNDLQPFIDHRLLVMARKAALYDKHMSANPQTKKVKSAPKTAKAGNPATKPDAKQAKVNQSRSRLKQTGKMRDAQAAIKNIISGA